MSPRLRHAAQNVLPWIISTALLVYVFGWATDWESLREATESADVPLFLLCAFLDRMAFFIVWTWMSALALRRFVAQVPVSAVFAMRGGSELARVVSNHIADGAYFLGLSQLAGGRIDAIVASALVPVVSHFFVMLVQMTVALLFVNGGLAANQATAAVAALLWAIVIALFVGVWLSRSGKIQFPGIEHVVEFADRFPLRTLTPFIAGFTVLAVFDVQIQWFASRAFGIDIEWSALAARIPVVYLSFLLPTLGNFGTRELAWANLFSDFGSPDALFAYALSINAVFLLLNALLGVMYLQRALELIRAVRKARRQGESLPRPRLHDPADG